ncbi:unnamed protein product [Urochloa decumbens]|uniref:Gnk2-homologous domain-containing protein n=1 Tax=Urochloa decumbens TaxID=240449 RepID=A0ABC9H7N4_9POAL
MARARATVVLALALLPVTLALTAAAPGTGVDYRRPAPSPGHKCSPGNHAGERPDNVAASAYCYWRPNAGWPSDCAACITRAFGEAQRLYPYHRQAMVVVDGGDCSVSFHDVQQREQSMGLGSPGEYVADRDHASYLDFLQYINKELIRYMSEHEMLAELKNFTERVTQASTGCLTM